MKDRIYRKMQSYKSFSLEHYIQAMSMGLFDSEMLHEMLDNDPQIKDHDPYWFYKQHYRNDLPDLKAFQYMEFWFG